MIDLFDALEYLEEIHKKYCKRYASASSRQSQHPTSHKFRDEAHELGDKVEALWMAINALNAIYFKETGHDYIAENIHTEKENIEDYE